MPPAKERIRTMAATPIAIPSEVRKVRPRLRRRLLTASLMWVRRSKLMSVFLFCVWFCGDFYWISFSWV